MKKLVSRFVLLQFLCIRVILLVLFSALAGAKFVNLASAQYFENIIIKVDGSVDPSTAPITRTGNVYTLTGNIIGSITIVKNDIIFDGLGYTVQYGGVESLPSNNQINHIGWGELTLDQVNHVTVKNVNIVGTGENSGVGIWLFATNNTIITNNTVSTIATGVATSGSCSGNIIAGNAVTNNDYGISLSTRYSRLSNNTIIGNNVTANNIGIKIWMNHEGDPSGNAVVGNQISNNGIGMHFLWLGDYYSWKPALFEMNNRIYNNNFINNNRNVVNAHIIYDPDCANIWDNSAIGNYWSDYEDRYPNATELDDSGIWDTPYVIDANNQDHYPLMNPVVIPEFPDTTSPTISIISPKNKTYTANNVSLAFTVNELTSWIGYSLNGKANVTMPGNTTLTGLPDGPHSLVICATDTAGNTRASETIYFRIVSPPPDLNGEIFLVTNWIFWGMIIIAVVGAALMVYFRRIRKKLPST